MSEACPLCVLPRGPHLPHPPCLACGHLWSAHALPGKWHGPCGATDCSCPEYRRPASPPPAATGLPYCACGHTQGCHPSDGTCDSCGCGRYAPPAATASAEPSDRRRAAAVARSLAAEASRDAARREVKEQEACTLAWKAEAAALTVEVARLTAENERLTGLWMECEGISARGRLEPTPENVLARLKEGYTSEAALAALRERCEALAARWQLGGAPLIAADLRALASERGAQ